MFAVRYVALAALVVWLGGMLALAAVVAPLAFRVLESAEPAAGRVLAGSLFAALLSRFHLIAYACGVTMIVALLVMKFVGPPPRAFILRLAIVVVMLGCEAYAAVWVMQDLTAIRAQVPGVIEQLPANDPRRARFSRLHDLSTTLIAANIALGLVLLVWYARE